MKKKQKFYVVWKGRDTGVFYSWDECYSAVNGFQGALYKSFEDEDSAFEALKIIPTRESFAKQKKVSLMPNTAQNKSIIQESIAVDAACSGNPGLMEYRGVDVRTGKQIFHNGPLADGTNNIGEFLAIVHGLALLEKSNSSLAIYSDSMTAIAWVRNKKCNSKLEHTPKNDKIFELITRAENWLRTHYYSTPIYKWETENWGEIPADFGRKK